MSDSAQNSPSYPKIATAACFGTFLEWYDFLTFATLAVAFAPLFFPSSDPVTGLLASLATFGAGMVVRPPRSGIFWFPGGPNRTKTCLPHHDYFDGRGHLCCWVFTHL